MTIPKFNLAIRILLGTNAMILLAPAMLAPIYAIFVEEIGGDLLDASFAASIFAIAAAGTSFMVGRFSDEFQNYRLILIVGSFIMALGYLLFMWVSSLWMLFAVQVVIGLGEAMYYPPYDALYSQHLDDDQSATTWGAWESMDYLISAVGAAMGGLIVNTWGFPTLFGIMSVFCLFSGLYLARLSPKTL